MEGDHPLIIFAALLACWMTGDVYQQPPASLAALVDQPQTPDAYVSPPKTHVALFDIAAYLPISELARDELRLAGLRFDPVTHAPADLRRRYRSISIIDFKDRLHVDVTGFPESAALVAPRWSPDGQRLAVAVIGDQGVSLVLVDPANGETKTILENQLNAVMGIYDSFSWMPDSKSLLARIVDHAEAPPESKVADGPVIREATGIKAPARTFQDLLKNPYDESLFEYYASSQLVVVDLEGEFKRLGPKGLIHRQQPSPDGQYLLVEMRRRPFSYLVPEFRFANRIEVWDLSGRLVKRLIEQPLVEDLPKGFNSVRSGMREFDWRPDVPATLTYAVALDGGDANSEAELRDEVFMWEAPFEADAVSLIKTASRFSRVNWSDQHHAFVSEWWWATRQVKTQMVVPGSGQPPLTLWQRSFQDRYSDPGTPLMAGPDENPWIQTFDEGRKIYLTGSGASPEGSYPFLDSLELATQKTDRLWQCKAPSYETVLDLADLEGKRVLTRFEQVGEPANYQTRGSKRGRTEVLTAFPHPSPTFRDIQKELIQYTREDGVALNGTLYLPPGYSAEQGPLPTILWAYPREFKSASDAGQVTDSPHRFNRLSPWGPMAFLAEGYAVLDNPTMPIIGVGDDEPNDRFIEQLVSSAKAAIDALVQRGVTDPDRVAIGGHSYGAFMTANLLAHSDLFRTGIARSGSYNRTLTPFGFQAEQRLFWEAPEIYGRMSPFFHADQINEPILLIHGADDSNPGTFPMQSERLFHAIKGLGGKARLVMLPYESHGYRARQSLLHMLWEEYTWLEMHLKSKADPAE